MDNAQKTILFDSFNSRYGRYNGICYGLSGRLEDFPQLSKWDDKNGWSHPIQITWDLVDRMLSGKTNPESVMRVNNNCFV